MRRAGRALLAVVLLALTTVVVALPGVTGPARAATTTTCGFATAGTGTFARSICWFDLSAYSNTTATSAAGQQFVVSLPAGYTLSFTVRSSGGTVNARAFPTYSGAFLGNRGFYTGVPGRPALYQASAGTTTTSTIGDLVLRGPTGSVQRGFALVGADAETTDSAEYLQWQSDQPIQSLTATATSTGIGNSCAGGYTGIGTTTVRCTGLSNGTRTGTPIVAADDPSYFTQTMKGGGLEGFAFGVQVSRLQLRKTVTNGYAGDSFALNVTDSDGVSYGTTNTNGGTSADTGEISVLTTANGSRYTLSETASAGSTADYTQSWSCTRNGQTDSSVPPASGTSASVVIGVGDVEVCGLTNTARPSSLSLAKRAGTVNDVNGNGITDTGDTIPYTFVVTNTGDLVMHQIAVADPTVGTVTCPSADLAAGASFTCTATYTVTDADVTRGTIVNTATASGRPGSTSVRVSSPASSTTTPTQAPAPAISLVKSSDTNDLVAGDTLTYTFVATNSGNVPLSDIQITEGNFTGSGTLGPVVCPADRSLAAGAQLTCTATYTITQSDVDARSITNNATASGQPATGARVNSPNARVGVPSDPAPALSVRKTVSPTTAARTDDSVTFSYVVTNTGNVTLSGVNVTETTFTGSGPRPTIACPTTTLRPGANTTCAGTYTLTQADVNAGQVANTGTAHALYGTQAVDSAVSNNAAVTIPAAPTLTLTKTVAPATVDRVNQTVTYTYTLHNGGNVTLSGVGITESNFTGTGTAPSPACAGTLAPDAALTCTATYRTTQADLDHQGFTNTATAQGTAPGAATPTRSRAANAPVTAVFNPSLSLVKSANPAAVSAAGTAVSYRFVITNTGNVTLSTASIIEGAFTGRGRLSDPSCPNTAASLAPGASVNCTASYTSVQDDIDAGGTITNDATVQAFAPGRTTATTATSSATLTVSRVPGLSVTKSASPTTAAQANDTVTYSFVVTNTGNTNVQNLTVTDSQFSGTGTAPAPSCPLTALAPGGTTTCTATYRVTQDDIDAGSVTDTATTQGRLPDGTAVVSPASNQVRVTATPSPALTVTKSAPGTAAGPGSVVTFAFVVTNTGNVTLAGVGVSETQFSGTGTPTAITCPRTTLPPGVATTCTSTYTVTRADADAGGITDTAQAVGTPPGSTTPITSPVSNQVSVTIPSAAALTVVKSASPNDAASFTFGRVITYSFVVTNTGNVTVRNLAVTDSGFSGSGPAPVVTCPPGTGTLAAGAQVTCTATYTVTQDDVDTGRLTNLGGASGTAPTGAQVAAPNSQVVIPADQQPAITLSKTADHTFVDAAAQTITYSFLVTNSGNVTLNGVGVTETAFSGTGTAPVPSCATTRLLPGAQVTCTATYRVTQADLDAGTAITNAATARGTAPGGTTTVSSDPSGTSVAVTVRPGITLAKTASPDTVSHTAQTVTFSYAVVNSGNVTLTGVGVTETAFTGSGTRPMPNCTVTTLTPGATTTCTATYTTTQADLDAGGFANTATAHGTAPRATAATVSPDSTATVAANTVAALDLVKAADPASITAAGQRITYSFTATNTGTVTLADVRIEEGAFGGDGTLSAATCETGAASLAPGGVVRCTATYTTTQADLDRGASVPGSTVSNDAVASGLAPRAGSRTRSGTARATLTPRPTSGLAVVKSVSPTRANRAGDTVTFTFGVTNTGNVTVSDIRVTETSFTGTGTSGAITCDRTTLTPAASTTCRSTYALTQDDVDAGGVDDTATASGTDPGGADVTSPVSNRAVVAVDPGPALSVTKSADPTAAAGAGATIQYTFLVTNTGNVTLSGVGVTDIQFSGTGPSPAIRCPVTRLAPGAATTCTAEYTLTSADADAGRVTDTARAQGTAPGATAPTLSPDSNQVVVAIPAAPQLALTKSVSPNDAASFTVGRELAFTYVVANTGNVTVRGIDLVENTFSGSDPLGAPACPADTDLAVGERLTCTATYTVTQDDVDAGRLVNTAHATGAGVRGGDVDSPASTAVAPADPRPGLTIAKSGSPTPVSRVGQTVTYTFVVTNTGNQSVHDVTVSENEFGGHGTAPIPRCPDPTPVLRPGAALTCTATYAVTQDDLDAGSFDNTATARATAPDGSPVGAPPSTTTVAVRSLPALEVTKSAQPAVATADQQRITWSFVVLNTGNVTLTGIDVTEGTLSGSGALSAVTCLDAADPLPPGVSRTCIAIYTVTQDDLDRGMTITNSATASGLAPRAITATQSPVAQGELAVQQNPALTATKQVDPSTATAADDKVTFTVTVTNSGNVTVTGVNVSETRFSGTATTPVLACADPTLAPGRSTSCSGTYRLTQDDIDAGRISDVSTAHATPPAGGNVDSPPTNEAIVSATPGPALTVTKAADPSTVSAAGATVTFRFTVVNTGNVTLSAVGVTETSFTGTGTPSSISCPVTVLRPTQRTVCNSTYTVTPDDADAGSIADTATAHGTPPSPGSRVDSPLSNRVDVSIPPAPGLSVVKSVSPSDAASFTVGRVLTYTFVVTNTGNVTVDGVGISEDSFTGSGELSAIDCPAGRVAAGAQTQCTARYTVTQDDVDAGRIVNTASAEALAPGDRGVGSPGSSTVVPAAPNPALTLRKTASPTTITRAGDRITYTFEITNTGNVTVHDARVVETAFTGSAKLDPPQCPAAAAVLTPGETVTCHTTYAASQADVEAGTVRNTAAAAGTAPDGSTVRSDGSTATVAANAGGRLEVTKTALLRDVNRDGRADPGDQIDWTIIVTNTGTATVRGLRVSDPSAGAVSCATTTLAPGARTTCSAPAHTVTAADAGAGTVRNRATASGSTGPGSSATAAATASLPVSAAPGSGPSGGGTTPPGELAFTGTPAIGLGGLGLTLILAGATVLVLARGRRSVRGTLDS